MPSQFPSRILAKFESEYSESPDYIRSFMSIAETNSYSVIEGIYNDVVSKLSLIFEDAKQSAYDLLFGVDFFSKINTLRKETIEMLVVIFDEYLRGTRIIIQSYFLEVPGTKRRWICF